MTADSPQPIDRNNPNAAQPPVGDKASPTDNRNRKTPMSISENIEQRLQAKGMTWYALARETGLTLTTIYRIRNGIQSPKLDSLSRIAQALGCKVGQLVTE